MKLHYDPAVDALYLTLGANAVVESSEVSPGVILDFDAGGKVVALEILDVRQRVAQPDVCTGEVEVTAS